MARGPVTTHCGTRRVGALVPEGLPAFPFCRTRIGIEEVLAPRVRPVQVRP